MTVAISADSGYEKRPCAFKGVFFAYNHTLSRETLLILPT